MRIETPRMYFRDFSAADQAALGMMFADQRVTRHLALDTMTKDGALEFAEEFIADATRELAQFGGAAMALVDREGHGFLGYAGLRPLLDRPRAAELMYALQPAFWGQGLASEAVAVLLRWGFSNLPMVEEVMGLVRAENTASINVMSKNGMRANGTDDSYYGEPLLKYSRFKLSETQSSDN